MIRMENRLGRGLPALALTCSLLASPVAMAGSKEEAKVADLEKKLDASMKLIAQLTARLDQLEKTKADQVSVDKASAVSADSAAKAVAASEASAAADARLAAVESGLVQMSDAANRANTLAGVPVHGFVDVRYAQSSQKVDDGRRSGFMLGNVDFYLTPQFSDRVRSLIELNFEYGRDGSLGVDLERMQLGYTFDNDVTLWAGRYHTPYGYWNTGYHHGAQIQTSILRPRMVAFEDEGGILPAHTVGLWATGETATGNGKLGFDAYVGNGSRIQTGVLDYNAVRDDNSNKLFGGALKYRFGGELDGLILGVHAMQGQIDDHGDGVAALSRNRLRMLGGFGYYENDNWEALGEYYHFSNRDLNSNDGSRSSWASFLQVGRNLDPGVMAFVRWEKASLDQNDSYFRALEFGSSYQRNALGLRYSLSPKAVLKVELDHTNDARAGKYNEAQLQAAIRF